jgi:disulfide bond formation protein DsbB
LNPTPGCWRGRFALFGAVLLLAKTALIFAINLGNNLQADSLALIEEIRGARFCGTSVLFTSHGFLTEFQSSSSAAIPANAGFSEQPRRCPI